MDKVVYSLCVGTSLLVTLMLFRAYFATHTRLLFWSGLCFCLLTVSNALLYLDFIVYTEGPDLSMMRNAATLSAQAVLIYGLIFRTS